MRDQTATMEDAEGGFTLVELIIAAALTIVVLLIASGLMLSSSQTSSAISSQTAASNLGQLISRSVTQGMANATAVTIATDGSGAQMLEARTYSMSPTLDPTQGSTNGVTCSAWYYTPVGGGAIYTKSIMPAAPISMPAGTPDNTWLQVGNGLNVGVGASPSSTVFATPSGSRVDLKFDVTNGSNQPVHIETTVHIPNSTTVSSPCF